MKQVTIHGNNDFFDIYEESGQAIEMGFKSYQEAKSWAEDNAYEVVLTFNI